MLLYPETLYDVLLLCTYINHEFRQYLAFKENCIYVKKKKPFKKAGTNIFLLVFNLNFFVHTKML